MRVDAVFRGLFDYKVAARCRLGGVLGEVGDFYGIETI
jgi:hypothetical protein